MRPGQRSYFQVLFAFLKLPHGTGAQARHTTHTTGKYKRRSLNRKNRDNDHLDGLFFMFIQRGVWRRGDKSGKTLFGDKGWKAYQQEWEEMAKIVYVMLLEVLR